MTRKTAFLTLLTTAAVLAACNTVDGAKRDVNSASGAVENATDGK